MTVKIFNRTINLSKGNKKEKFKICGLNIEIELSIVDREEIKSILVTTTINKCLTSRVEFTKTFFRDSSYSDLVILNSIFSHKISYEILKQLHP